MTGMASAQMSRVQDLRVQTVGRRGALDRHAWHLHKCPGLVQGLRVHSSEQGIGGVTGVLKCGEGGAEVHAMLHAPRIVPS